MGTGQAGRDRMARRRRLRLLPKSFSGKGGKSGTVNKNGSTPAKKSKKSHIFNNPGHDFYRYQAWILLSLLYENIRRTGVLASVANVKM